jgi:hypothetical protein
MDNGLPLYDRQGPPASCSIMNIGLPLSQRRKAPVGRSKMKLTEEESSSWKKQDEAPQSWVRSKRTASVFYGFGDAPGPSF